MKQFSAIWYLRVFLKAAAVYFALSTALNILTAFPTEFDSMTIRFLGVPLVIGRAIYMIMTAIWLLLSGLAASAALLAISEMLRITANHDLCRATTAHHETSGCTETACRRNSADGASQRDKPIAPPYSKFATASSDLQSHRRNGIAVAVACSGRTDARVTVFAPTRQCVHEPRPAAMSRL